MKVGQADITRLDYGLMLEKVMFKLVIALLPRVFVVVQERVLKERQHHGRTREGVSFVLGPPGIWSMLAVLHMAEGDEQAMAQVRQPCFLTPHS